MPLLHLVQQAAVPANLCSPCTAKAVVVQYPACYPARIPYPWLYHGQPVALCSIQCTSGEPLPPPLLLLLLLLMLPGVPAASLTVQVAVAAAAAAAPFAHTAPACEAGASAVATLVPWVDHLHRVINICRMT
jgi:hypothetical protein